MFVILIWWLALLAVFAGIGLLLRAWFKLPLERFPSQVLDCFWIGWVAHLAFLMLWHLILPAKQWPLVVLAIAGGFGLFRERGTILGWVKQTVVPWGLWFLVAAVIGLWLADRCLGPIACADTLIYHLSAVRWFADHAIVPGLANLHDRFGVHSTSHLYAAMLEFGTWSHRSHHVALGLLYFVVCLQLLNSFRRLVSGSSDARRPGLDLFLSLLIAPLLYLIPDINSHSTDLPVFILGIVVADRFWRMCVPARDTELEQKFSIFALVAMACAGVTIKVSFLVFGGVTAAIALAFWFARKLGDRDKPGPRLVALVVLGLLFVGPWLSRGVVFSGYPLYPSTALSLPVDWRMPKMLVEQRKLRTMAWCREPVTHWAEVLDDNKWLMSWQSALTPEVIVLLQILFIGLLLNACAGRSNDNGPWPKARIFLLPAAASCLFWFLTAPDPRFAGTAPWIVALGSLSIGLQKLLHRSGQGAQSSLLGALAVLAFIAYCRPLPKRLLVVPSNSKHGFHQVRKPRVKPDVTDTGLTVYRGATGDDNSALADSPLPCSPMVHRKLAQRHPGKLSSGFRIEPSSSVTEMLLYGEPLPPGVSASGSLGVLLAPVQSSAGESATSGGWLLKNVRNTPLTFVSPAKTVIYAGSAGSMTVSLQPVAGSTPGKLAIRDRQGKEHAAEIREDLTTVIDVPLGRGFNILTFKLTGIDGTVSKEKDKEPQSLSVSALSFTAP